MPRKASTESVADTHAAPGGAAAVDRALSLLSVFRSGDVALNLTELAERTRLYKSTVLRLLASLEHAGLVRRLDDGPHRGAWALGAEVARLHSIYAAAFSLDALVLPVLQRLVVVTGESAAYHVRQGRPPNASRLCLHRVDSPQPIRDHIRAGDLLPLDRGAGARVLIAFDEELARVSDPKDHELYVKLRARGYFASVGDREAEVAGISAPVFKAGGGVVAALTLTMPAHRYDERHITPVMSAARELSSALGWAPPLSA